MNFPDYPNDWKFDWKAEVKEVDRNHSTLGEEIAMPVFQATYSRSLASFLGTRDMKGSWFFSLKPN